MRGVQERQSFIVVLSSIALVFVIVIHACSPNSSAKAVQFIQITQGILMFTSVYILTETSKGRRVSYGDFARRS